MATRETAWPLPPVMTEPPLDPRTVAESNMNIPPQNAWTFGQYTTHASVCWQYITMTNFPPTLDHRGYPIALWHNLRGFFTARSRYGVSNALLKKDYQIAVIEDLEDFLLLCSKHSRQAIANSWNRLHHPLPSIDAAFVGGRMRQALQNVADTRGFDVRYLSEELDHARWYTETSYTDIVDALRPPGVGPPAYFGPADRNGYNGMPRIPAQRDEPYSHAPMRPTIDSRSYTQPMQAAPGIMPPLPSTAPSTGPRAGAFVTPPARSCPPGPSSNVPGLSSNPPETWSDVPAVPSVGRSDDPIVLNSDASSDGPTNAVQAQAASTHSTPPNPDGAAGSSGKKRDSSSMS